MVGVEGQESFIGVKEEWEELENYNTVLHFLNFFKPQEEELIILAAFFSADYECLNRFFHARPDFPKFCVKSLKFTLNGCFYLVLMLKIANSFNAMHA